MRLAVCEQFQWVQYKACQGGGGGINIPPKSIKLFMDMHVGVGGGGGF